MRLPIQFGKKGFAIVIILFALVAYVLGIFLLMATQSKDFFGNNLEDAVLRAEKLTLFDKTIPIERSLHLFSQDLSYALFNSNCEAFHSTDLLILTSDCRGRNGSYEWRQFKGLNGQDYIVGYLSPLISMSYLYGNKQIIIAVTMAYAFFVIGLTYIFFAIFINRPIKRIKSEIDYFLTHKDVAIQELSSTKDRLLASLYDSIEKLILEVTKYNREKDKLQLSTQIAHDLRAPLSILEQRMVDKNGVNDVQAIAIKRIKAIAESLMPSSYSSPGDIRKTIDDIKKLYSGIQIDVSGSETSKDIKLRISETDLFRILANLVKNSIESSATKIDIKIHSQNEFLSILISDNGKGISPELLPRLIDGFTTKQNGNGLGISGINKMISNIGGRIELDSSPGKGFSVKLIIPILAEANLKTNVLIDDDKMIRIGWELQAKKVNVLLYTFNSVSAFLNSPRQFPIDANIFIDSDLGEGLKGETLSKKISDRGYKNIYLATGYSRSDVDLSASPWIIDVVSKRCPF